MLKIILLDIEILKKQNITIRGDKNQTIITHSHYYDVYFNFRLLYPSLAFGTEPLETEEPFLVSLIVSVILCP